MFQQVAVRLPATLLVGDRLHPVTILGLSEVGFYAEGVAFERIESDFSVEIELPPSAEPSWSPKASCIIPRGARGSLLRARARLLEVEGGAGSRPIVSAVHARLEDMSEECRRGLRRWLEQHRRAGLPVMSPPPSTSQSSDASASA
jgi:hypothetical protein